MRSPVLWANPVRTAAPFPRFVGWVTTRTVLSFSWRSTSVVPSLLPSSTTMISRSRPSGSSTARIRRKISATVLRSFSTGTITETFLNSETRFITAVTPRTSNRTGWLRRTP